ncbi:hypothetical protein HOC01_00490 [archaeon]|jgi:phytol kinase|nr:hypothetical protein [archaeon]MBT6698682.1 hypothetical protein [archaeon]
MIKKQELHRQIFHTLLGLTIIFLLIKDILSPLSLFLITLAGLITSFIQKNYKIPIITKILNIFGRDHENESFPGKGAFYFFLGVLLTVQLFPKDIALASIIILTLGDSLSHIVGAAIGQTNNPFKQNSNKFIEGPIFGATAGFVGALLFIPIHEAFLAATIAMTAELAELKFGDKILDDNILVPLVAGTTILLLRTFLPIIF